MKPKMIIGNNRAEPTTAFNSFEDETPVPGTEGSEGIGLSIPLRMKPVNQVFGVK